MLLYQHAKMTNADYMDRFGNIYEIQNYNRALKEGRPTRGIEVYDYDGNFIGIAKKGWGEINI